MADKQKDPSWHQGENPFENASCCSYLFFFFFSKLMAHGNKNELEPKDIPPPHESNKTIFIDRDFEAAYAYEVERWKRIKATNLRGMCCTRSKYPSVVRTLLFAHGRNLWVGQSWAFVWASFSLVTPFAVRVLLKNISKKTDTYTFLGVSNLWALSFIIFVCQIIQSIGYNQGCAFAAYAGVTMRASLITAVYKKSLRLTSKSRSTSTSGEMVNMMSNDAVRVWKACQLGHFAWSGFLMTIAVMVILVFEVGVMGGLAGSVLLAFITPLVLFLSRYQGILRRRMLGFSDERIKVMGEVLSGIRVVKAYNWQDPLKRKVQSIRNDEIYISLQSHLLNGFSKVLMYLSPSLIMLLVFGVYSSNGGDMDISLVLTVLAFLNSVKFPMNVMPFAAQAIAEAIVSADRIGFFLNLDELPHMSIKSSSNERSNSVVNDSICQDSAIVVTNGCFAWDKQQEDHPTLSNININISKGDLIGIVGSVGSGKSSLIFALLKEMHQIDGVVKVNGNIAYCSQQAWIRNATVRDNILFGCPYDKDLYDRVLKASSLENDLIALSSGDATEIGERGINLSGGQKQRVSLARSLYLHESRDIFLLDDVLSAVDEETASFIFLNAISSKVGSSSSNANTAILKNKTRVLVMNSHLHLLSYMDKIIVLENGKIQAFDSLSEVLLKVDWLNELLRGEGGLFDNNDETNTGQRVELLESKKSIGSTKEEENQQVKKGTKEGHKIETTQAGATTAIEASAGSKLIKEEDRVKGHVKADTYVYYFGMAWPGHGYLLAFMVVLTFIISEIARILSDYMLSTYSNGKEPPSLWIPPYASVVGASSVFALLRVILFMGVTVYAGMNLHNALFISILGAHVRGKDAVIIDALY
jgi:ABC-type multidrug transport system fused ATPase/permease subunit